MMWGASFYQIIGKTVSRITPWAYGRSVQCIIPTLIWSDLFWPVLICSDLFWSVLICSDLICSDLFWCDVICSDLFCSDLIYSDLICSDLIWSTLIWSTLIWSVLCYFIVFLSHCTQKVSRFRISAPFNQVMLFNNAAVFAFSSKPSILRTSCGSDSLSNHPSLRCGIVLEYSAQPHTKTKNKHIVTTKDMEVLEAKK